MQKITIDFENMSSSIGHASSLDRSMAPRSGQSLIDKKSFTYRMETADVTNDWEEQFELSENNLRSCLSASLPHQYFPYAVTFTFNSKCVTQSVPRQWSEFTHLYTLWMKRFMRRMICTNDTRVIGAYEVYPELTHRGVLHAHGLIWFTSNYFEATGATMTKAWVELTKKMGASMTAMKKKNDKGGYDYAFAKCNNVDKWRKYITKEHPQYYPKPCLKIIDDQYDFDYEINEVEDECEAPIEWLQPKKQKQLHLTK
jgi:hypothetical protein